MSDDPRFPPVTPGPFLPLWPGHPAPRLARPQVRQPPYPAGGGLSVPPSAPQTFSLQGVATMQGTRVFPVTAASVKILDAPATYRNFLLIRNSSAAAVTVFVEFGTDATLNTAVALLQNEIILFDAVVPQDDIFVIGSGAGQVSVLLSVIALPV